MGGGGEEREGGGGKRKGRRIRGVEGVRRERETCYLPQMFIRSNHNPSDQIFMDVFHFFFFLFSFVPFSSPLSAPPPPTHTHHLIAIETVRANVNDPCHRLGH